MDFFSSIFLAEEGYIRTYPIEKPRVDRAHNVPVAPANESTTSTTFPICSVLSPCPGANRIADLIELPEVGPGLLL